MHILLLGIYGSGKSSIGKIIAHDLNATFVEMDSLIFDATGAKDATKIPPSHWNLCQIDICRDLSTQDGLIIAASGNIIENNVNILLFQEHDPTTFIVYLKTDIETLLSRTINHVKQEKPHMVRERLQQLLQARESLYMRYADYIIDTSNQTPRALATTILQAMNARIPPTHL